MESQWARGRYRPLGLIASARSGRGGRAVDCTGLENRQTRKGFGSSNLPLSANIINKLARTWGGRIPPKVALERILNLNH